LDPDPQRRVRGRRARSVAAETVADRNPKAEIRIPARREGKIEFKRSKGRRRFLYSDLLTFHSAFGKK
ncbi:MAG TPA: hypothetical protein VG099_08540, partial [Gemmataceae bacterium]|nr:hypothetical protein [Gemmataceae bacterium]